MDSGVSLGGDQPAGAVHLSGNRKKFPDEVALPPRSDFCFRNSEVEIPGAKPGSGRLVSHLFNGIGRRGDAFPAVGMRRSGLILLHPGAAEQTGRVEGFGIL